MSIRNRLLSIEKKRNVRRNNFVSSNFCSCYQTTLSGCIAAVYGDETPSAWPESRSDGWCPKCQLPVPRQLIERMERSVEMIFGGATADDIPLLG